jgi:hypothetical protein
LVRKKKNSQLKFINFVLAIYYICRNFEVNTKGVEAVSKTKGVGADSIVGKYLPFFLKVSETKNFQSNRTINLTLKCKILDQLRYKYHEKTGTNVVY